MVTDDERRAVVARLRDSAEERMASKGRGNGNSWSWLYRSVFGHYMDTTKGAKCRYVEVARRLADLIEPGEPKTRCVAEVKIDGELLEQLVHDAAVELTVIDRDALLGLAEEMEDLVEAWGGKYPPNWVAAYAHRIREAIGAEK